MVDLRTCPNGHRSGTATVQAGVQGPELERLLGARGHTLGHFPQSFEYSASAAGRDALRRPGLDRQGRIDELVTGLRCATPSGDWDGRPARQRRRPGPARAADRLGGHARRDHRGTLRVRRGRARQRFDAWMPGFAAGAEALRDARAGRRGARRRAALRRGRDAALARAVGRRTEPRAICSGATSARAAWRAAVWSSSAGWATPTRSPTAVGRAGAPLRRAGGAGLGAPPGRCLGAGALTMALPARPPARPRRDGRDARDGDDREKAFALHAAVADALRGALEARGTPALVGCHVSHLYPSGCSLYFTFLARQERGAEIEQWAAAKRAASEAIVAQGATITHHHAVGVDHAPYLEAEAGRLGIAALRAVKAEIDPAGIMNPGKLLPADRAG